ncbi:hypothetical protein J1N10_04550 [Carboxylicivirga sp. A043]|uniref:hypothetical protein n=1 Tax=Carboxylicivirga litoralis TaxID=2816963 RepID=UPI0021CB6157|nr:hypothetical protein [Carboxylicivirga sp. A043]MCU4155232.1 hypothetical protein [Carboxylicivirga sp. A043]
MKLQQLFENIKGEFNALWKYKQRGDTLEIVCPYATTQNRFVSVFVTKQGNDFIISDGAWVSGGIYNEEGLGDESCFIKVLEHFRNAYNILETHASNGSIYYYLKTSNPIDIPSKVFDLSTFIQNILSVADIAFENKQEKESVKRFASKANNFLKSFIPSYKIKVNDYLNPDKKELKFNALYFASPSKITLINYITGSTNTHFSNSIFKANTLFEMAEASIMQPHIAEKLSVVDTDALGYSPEKIGHYLLHLERQTASKIINWVEREKLQSLLN